MSENKNDVKDTSDKKLEAGEELKVEQKLKSVIDNGGTKIDDEDDNCNDDKCNDDKCNDDKCNDDDKDNKDNLKNYIKKKLRSTMDQYLHHEYSQMFHDFKYEIELMKKQGIKIIPTIDELWEPHRLLRIQFGVFEQRDKEDISRWYLNSIWPSANDEGIYSTRDIKFSDEGTFLVVDSREGNHHGFNITDSITDYSYLPHQDCHRIFIRDLYDDFKPRKFSGKCTTNGWNWFEI